MIEAAGGKLERFYARFFALASMGASIEAFMVAIHEAFMAAIHGGIHDSHPWKHPRRLP